MNPFRWTLYKTGDDRDRGFMVPTPSLDDLRKYETQGYNWTDRGYSLESIKDVILDLEMAADIADMDKALDKKHEADEIFFDDDIDAELEEFDIHSLWQSLRHSA